LVWQYIGHWLLVNLCIDKADNTKLNVTHPKFRISLYVFPICPSLMLHWQAEQQVLKYTSMPLSKLLF